MTMNRPPANGRTPFADFLGSPGGAAGGPPPGPGAMGMGPMDAPMPPMGGPGMGGPGMGPGGPPPGGRPDPQQAQAMLMGLRFVRVLLDTVERDLLGGGIQSTGQEMATPAPMGPPPVDMAPPMAPPPPLPPPAPPRAPQMGPPPSAGPRPSPRPAAPPAPPRPAPELKTPPTPGLSKTKIRR